MKKSTLLLAMLSAAFLAGCGTPPTYGDPKRGGTLSTGFTRSDYQQTAHVISESLKSNPHLLETVAQFKNEHGGQKPKIAVEQIKNDTRNITLKPDVITDLIKTEIVNSGLFVFTGNEKAIKGRKFDEANDVLVAPGASSGFSDARGADYVLTGTITQLDDEGGRTREKTYILSMQLNNMWLDQIDWIDNAEIMKYSQRAGFGF